ncbi:hypothetical protein ABZX95_00520 [Streptomyces sp. NPDC004232]
MTDRAWDYNPSAQYVAGRGVISFLAVPRHECAYVCNVTWYG